MVSGGVGAVVTHSQSLDGLPGQWWLFREDLVSVSEVAAGAAGKGWCFVATNENDFELVTFDRDEFDDFKREMRAKQSAGAAETTRGMTLDDALRAVETMKRVKNPEQRYPSEEAAIVLADELVRLRSESLRGPKEPCSECADGDDPAGSTEACVTCNGTRLMDVVPNDA
jgi:hypothetical protein